MIGQSLESFINQIHLYLSRESGLGSKRSGQIPLLSPRTQQKCHKITTSDPVVTVLAQLRCNKCQELYLLDGSGLVTRRPAVARKQNNIPG